MRSSITEAGVLSLNAKAVKLMNRGEFAQAIEFLEHALRSVHGSGLGLDDVRMHKSIEGGLKVETLSVPACRSLSSAFSFFNKAITISRNLGDCSASLIGLNRLSVVLLFNTAIALHSLGHEAFLRKAVRFYRMAMALSDSTADSAPIVERLVYLASVNNLGYIHYYFSEKGEATNCLIALRILLTQWEQRDEFISRNFTMDDILNFNLTVLYYGCLDFALPTAVAA